MNVGFLTRQILGNLKTVEPSKIALKLESDEAWTYEELHRRSNAYGNALCEMGIAKGDRVGILLYNCLEYWALYFACAKIGAIAVRLNFRLASEEFQYALSDSGTKVLCFHSSLAEKLDPIRAMVPVERYVSLPFENKPVPQWAEPWDVMEEGDLSEITDVPVELADPVMLMYTSGTTGRPKGALWTHANTLWFCAIQIMKWNLSVETICLTAGPLYHVGGMEDLALPTLLAGGTVIITRSGGFSIERVVEVVEKEQVTDVLLFPFMIYEMLNAPRLADFKLSCLKRIVSGGDPVIPWAIERIHERFPHVGLVQIYGLTEGSPIAASLDPQDAKRKGHTVGKPMPLTEIKVVDEQNRPVPTGEAGEICIKNPVVSLGYWQKPGATAATFVDGWCHTGDLGKIDEDGYLMIAGRKKDMIRSGGENIYPIEIEDVLIRHPAVKDVAVIAIPDPKYVETVCAVIVPKQRSDIKEELIVQFCTDHLAGYKKPRRVVFVDEIPRTPSGKIQKYVLRERLKSLGTHIGQQT
ncbi:class I adenylate-forming enzyme family protein [Effusibacillus dendaii]|uniref:Long-chain-fatty-acid--CoA ligase n=1 Tax=Effusibacillus dendaii TaxID=2743772 RepID=A0A7I8DDZ8_9BACL|nr:AMP-binding protein [Effusibacillus dendaii]BCJ86111.1 long-chain-fatty-acid--CoA ligase [Effusibacillus dendaii]